MDDARWSAFSRKRDALARESERLKSTWVHPRTLSAPEAERVLGKAIEREYPLFELLRRPGVAYEALLSLEGGRWRPSATDSGPARPAGWRGRGSRSPRPRAT